MQRHERLVMGVEPGWHKIQTPSLRIVRELALPRKVMSQQGERAGRDSSIGTE